MAIPIDSVNDGADRKQLELLRAATPARRLRLTRSLSASMIALSRMAIRRRSMDLPEREVSLRFAAVHYGDELAAKLRADLDRRGI